MTHRSEGMFWELAAATALTSASFGPVVMPHVSDLEPVVALGYPDNMQAYMRDEQYPDFLEQPWLPLGPDPHEGMKAGGRGYIANQYPQRALHNR
jgi:hypothetical protein